LRKKDIWPPMRTHVPWTLLNADAAKSSFVHPRLSAFIGGLLADLK